MHPTTSSTGAEIREVSGPITHGLIVREISEAQSELNKYYTYEEVGHEPTETEALIHYGLHLAKEHAKELVQELAKSA